MIKVCIMPFSALEGAPNFAELVSEYAAEAGLDGMPTPEPHLETYRTLDKAGIMTTLCAYQDGVIVGFLTVLVSVIPHYSVPVAHLESFFVLKKSRASGAGMRLIYKAEEVVTGKGAVGMMISAVVGGQLEGVLMRIASYKLTHSGFFRSLV